jgi:hypothetical protein
MKCKFSQVMMNSREIKSYNIGLARFQIFTVVVMKSSSFWVITSCSQLKVNGRFEGTCRLHLQGGRISQARNQSETDCKQSH